MREDPPIHPSPATAPDTAGVLATWRAARSAEVLLSCGLRVTLRKVKLLDLAAQGRIPTPLHNQVQALLNDTRQMSIAVDQFAEWVGVINLVVIAAVAYPPVAEEPGEGVVGVEELPVDDRLFIWNWAQREAAPLATFLS